LFWINTRYFSAKRRLNMIVIKIFQANQKIIPNKKDRSMFIIANIHIRIINNSRFYSTALFTRTQSFRLQTSIYKIKKLNNAERKDYVPLLYLFWIKDISSITRHRWLVKGIIPTKSTVLAGRVIFYYLIPLEWSNQLIIRFKLYTVNQ
jgi:hypothetical protein